MAKCKPKHYGIFEFKHLENTRIEWCDCSSTKRNMRKTATHAVFVLKIPAGFLCQKCMKEWIRVWKAIYECPE